MAGAITEIEFRGLPALHLATTDGAEAIVTRHGAQLVSWRVAGIEQLYLSERARFARGEAIRGGVPVIFPQFGPAGSLPRHGFARTAEWQVAERRAGADFATATLRLSEDLASHPAWPHAFVAELTVALAGPRLDLELAVENPGKSALAFTAALHTYLRVGEVELARLVGLQGLRYRDQPSGEDATDPAPALTVEDETDRIYFDAPGPLLLRDGARSLAIAAENFPDVVVWNPWDVQCARLPDMPPTGFRRMLCVEAAAIGRPVCVGPQAAWWGRQTLSVL